MNRTTGLFLLCAGALAQGCATTLDTGRATTPVAVAAATPSCSALREEVTVTKAAKNEALEKAQAAWQVVVPFAVAARYASAKADASEAEQKLVTLREQMSVSGCALGGIDATN